MPYYVRSKQILPLHKEYATGYTLRKNGISLCFNSLLLIVLEKEMSDSLL